MPGVPPMGQSVEGNGGELSGAGVLLRGGSDGQIAGAGRPVANISVAQSGPKALLRGTGGLGRSGCGALSRRFLCVRTVLRHGKEDQTQSKETEFGVLLKSAHNIVRLLRKMD